MAWSSLRSTISLPSVNQYNEERSTASTHRRTDTESVVAITTHVHNCPRRRCNRKSGRAVVDQLLTANDDAGDEFAVHGLTRDASSENAQALAERGVTVVEGNLGDKESLRTAVDDVDDYGAVAARVFTAPNEYVGETIEVAGDEQTLENMAATFTDVLDTDVEAVHVPLDDAREQLPEDLVTMYEWFNEEGYTADIDALETEFDIQFHSLATYLRNHEWYG